MLQAETIIPQHSALHPTSAARVYQIAPIVLHVGPALQMATGVLVQPDGRAVLGQTQTDPDDGTFQVTPFCVGGRYLPAPAGWQADVRC